MSADLTVKILDWPSARDEAERIRMAVFVREQNVPPEIEIDDMDECSEHALALLPDGRAVGTGRLLPDGHIGRMAVLSPWRGRGVGLAVLDALVLHASREGFAEVVLNAQTQAQGFYAKRGFVVRGPTFIEAGIPHVEMWRAIQEPASRGAG